MTSLQKLFRKIPTSYDPPFQHPLSFPPICSVSSSFCATIPPPIDLRLTLGRTTSLQGLFRKILKGKIAPDKLVRMTPEELASKELAKWRERENQHVSGHSLC